VTEENGAFRKLVVMLIIYFGLLFSVVLAVGLIRPEAFSLLPLGGTDALEVLGFERAEQSFTDQITSAPGTELSQGPTFTQIISLVVFLSASLIGTLLVMLPVAWTYSAISREAGYRKSFVRTLLVLPICATTIVLLIQNNLALAFGLAAMVAAVRFRVSLREAIDGIFIFASICVGLAAGIGFLGIGAVMAVFFCFTNAILWKIEFGRNPIDDARMEKKRAEMRASRVLPGIAEPR
jgi:hypothetical protein